MSSGYYPTRMFREASVILGALVIASSESACSLPAQRPDFSSIDPQERTLAAAEAARLSDRSSIPSLIEMLDSSDSAQRMLAITSLERLTGQTLDYAYWAPEHQRNKAVNRWVEWWRSTRSAAPRAGDDSTANK